MAQHVDTETASPVLPLTRITLAVAIALVTIAGLQLYAASTRTAEFFAWTIRAPITAAFLGAGYWSNIPSLVLAVRHRDWQRIRIQVVATFGFTILILLATLRSLNDFHLGDEDVLPRIAAWAWLVVYVVLPFPLVAFFILQERAGGAAEYGVNQPPLPWVRLFFTIQALIMTAIAIGLIIPVPFVQQAWPWTLGTLPAGAVGAWIAGIAVATWWGLREGDWLRVRLFMPTYVVFWALQLIAAIRFWSAFDASDPATWIYLGAAILLPVLTILAAVTQNAVERSHPAANEEETATIASG